MGHHPRTIRPCDASRREVTEYLSAEQHRREAARLREKRRRQAAAREFSCRASAVLAVLDPDHLQTVREIAAALAGCKAFERPDGRPLTADSLRRVIESRTAQTRPGRPDRDQNDDRKARREGAAGAPPLRVLRVVASAQNHTSEPGPPGQPVTKAESPSAASA
jgi:hypothetical protein